MHSATPFLKLEKLTLDDWKKFWNSRGFTAEITPNGILDRNPDVIKRIIPTGPYFTVVVNYTNMSFDYVQGVSQLTGFSSQEFYDGKMDFLLGLIHPDDSEKVLGLTAHYYSFLDLQPTGKRLDFKAGINFRLRKADGQYVKVLEQIIGLHMDEEGRITNALKYFTDISHLNHSNEVVCSILDDMNNERQQFYTFDLEVKTAPEVKGQPTPAFSDRELEVLSLIARGMSSKLVADELGISPHTIDKHRKNMMLKTGSKNFSEVISFAYSNEYL